MPAGMHREKRDGVLVQLRIGRDEHTRWRAAVADIAPSLAELVRRAVRAYVEQRPPTATRTPLPWVLRRAGAYLAEVDGDRKLAHEALDLAASAPDAAGRG